MGLLFFLFISFSAFAADCVDAIPPTPAFCDNLYINNPINLSAAAGPIVVNVTGVVEIKANITLNGTDGVTLPAASAGTPGGAGGPGATPGGGLDGLGSPEDGQDGLIANGKAPAADITCANGGGGGALATVADNGGTCATSGSIGGAGGNPAPNTEFDFTLANFRGGYGGAAGGISSAVSGSGGGGGGALHIIAGGNVVINSGVTIFAVGGKGGDASTIDGAGGGGSGGALWIESTGGTILNYGTLNLLGGAGGINPSSLGDGGKGGNGVYKFEDINGPTTGTGLVTPTIFPPTSSTQSLKSSISCASLAKKNDQNNLAMQMIVGFLMAIFLRILFRHQKKIS